MILRRRTSLLLFDGAQIGYLIAGTVGVGIIAIFASPTVILLFTALMVFYTMILVTNNIGRVESIHDLVNNRMSIVVARVNQLTATMDKAGLPVPPPPNEGDLDEIAHAQRGLRANRDEGKTDA